VPSAWITRGQFLLARFRQALSGLRRSVSALRLVAQVPDGLLQLRRQRDEIGCHLPLLLVVEDLRRVSTAAIPAPPAPMTTIVLGSALPLFVAAFPDGCDSSRPIRSN
jgi:hypothetical protein